MKTTQISFMILVEIAQISFYELMFKDDVNDEDKKEEGAICNAEIWAFDHMPYMNWFSDWKLCTGMSSNFIAIGTLDWLVADV